MFIWPGPSSPSSQRPTPSFSCTPKSAAAYPCPDDYPWAFHVLGPLPGQPSDGIRDTQSGAPAPKQPSSNATPQNPSEKAQGREKKKTRVPQNKESLQDSKGPEPQRGLWSKRQGWGRRLQPKHTACTMLQPGLKALPGYTCTSLQPPPHPTPPHTGSPHPAGSGLGEEEPP